MLATIVVSAMFLMGLGACGFGIVSMFILMKESFRDGEKGAAFGMLGTAWLFAFMFVLLIVVWICFLEGGFKGC